MKRYNRQITALVAVLLFVLVKTVTPASGVEDVRRTALERFATRFSDEIYPLFARNANGCGACHHSESPRLLRVLNSSRATFSLLLEEDLFHTRDPMAIPSRVSSHDPDLRMPMAGNLTTDEIESINGFARDLEETLSSADDGVSTPPDERFPDSLLLSYDGKERVERIERRMSYYQLRSSFAAIFGIDRLNSSGPDPFKNRANVFGGADFRSSFETSRTVSASYLAGFRKSRGK